MPKDRCKLQWTESTKQVVANFLKASETFPSSENMNSTGKDPQHSIIDEDSTTLIARRAWCPQVLCAKDRHDRGRDARLEQAQDSFYTSTTAKGHTCSRLRLEPYQVR